MEGFTPLVDAVALAPICGQEDRCPLTGNAMGPRAKDGSGVAIVREARLPRGKIQRMLVATASGITDGFSEALDTDDRRRTDFFAVHVRFPAHILTSPVYRQQSQRVTHEG